MTEPKIRRLGLERVPKNDQVAVMPTTGEKELQSHVGAAGELCLRGPMVSEGWRLSPLAL